MIILKNPAKPYIAAIDTDGLVDTNSVYLCIPEPVREQLQLEPRGHKEITFRDGSRESVAYVGPVEVQFKSRIGFVGALVLGSEVLLGSLPMEEMDLTDHLRVSDGPESSGSIDKSEIIERPSYGSFAVVRSENIPTPATSPATPKSLGPTPFPQVIPEPPENLHAVG